MAPSLFVNLVTKLLPLTGRVSDDIIRPCIRPIGWMVASLPWLSWLPMVVGVLGRPLPHWVVSLQDPLSSVTPLLRARFLGRFLVGSPLPLSLLTWWSRLVPRRPLPWAHIVFSEWPTPWQVLVEERIKLGDPFALGLGGSLAPVPFVARLVALRSLPPSSLDTLRKAFSCYPLPPVSVLRLQVSIPLFLTLELPGEGTLMPNFPFPLPLVPLPLDGSNISRRNLVYSR